MRLREGKNPDRRLSVPKYKLSGEGKEVSSLRQLGGWLRSSHSFKECVIAHQSSGFAPKMVGTKLVTEATDSANGFVHSRDGRRASPLPGSCSVRGGGAMGSEDAGMSTR